MSRSVLLMCRRGGRLTETNEQSVTLIMIVVVLVFMVCHVPAKVVEHVATWQQQQQQIIIIIVMINNN